MYLDPRRGSFPGAAVDTGRGRRMEADERRNESGEATQKVICSMLGRTGANRVEAVGIRS